MRKIYFVTISSIILLVSCRYSTELVSDLVINKYKYYYKGTNKLFSGVALTKFENGLISSSTEIKDGIPNGKWFDYGYNGEVIHEGKFVPVKLQEPLIMEKNIERVNISFYKEGDFSFIDVYIVGQKIFTEGLSDTTKFKINLGELLRKKELLKEAESSYELKIVKGELE